MTQSVAFQGVAGALGEEACLRFLPDFRRIAKPSFAAVADAVRQGEADVGMLPQVNSTVGPVPGIETLIREYGLTVRACHDLPVHLHLMARPGVSIDTLEAVVSHPMALGQCAALLGRLGIEVEEAANTAMAAQALSASPHRAKAAIASEAAALAHGLTILMRDVHDREDNVTTFCIVARDQEESR